MRERLNPEVEGTGSGLGICLELCDKMQANLSARSTVGRGSVFRVELCRGLPEKFDTHQGIAILDDPAHWPEEVIKPVRDRGIPIRFIKNFDEAQTADWGVIIVDPALHPRPPEHELGCAIAICSYESSSANLGEWTTASPIALTKPVTADGVLHLMKLLNSSGQGSEGSKA
jgi:hypothetical protein